MSSKGRPAAIWKHYSVVFKELDSGIRVKDGYTCNKCMAKVSAASKEGYRHLKNCSATSSDEKQTILANLPANELKTYEKYWVPGFETFLTFL